MSNFIPEKERNYNKNNVTDNWNVLSIRFNSRAEDEVEAMLKFDKLAEKFNLSRHKLAKQMVMHVINKEKHEINDPRN